jgi:hypothetical protein
MSPELRSVREALEKLDPKPKPLPLPTRMCSLARRDAGECLRLASSLVV